MGNFQKYWSQNVGQDFIVLEFFVGGISCGRKRCVREINVSRAWDPVHAGDKALARETPAKRRRVNRYEITDSTHWTKKKPQQVQKCGSIKFIFIAVYGLFCTYNFSIQSQLNLKKSQMEPSLEIKMTSQRRKKWQTKKL